VLPQRQHPQHIAAPWVIASPAQYANGGADGNLCVGAEVALDLATVVRERATSMVAVPWRRVGELSGANTPAA
jgi:hypothetical protein